MFLKRKMNDSTNSYSDKILQIKEKISQADAVIIGAGAGLSTSAGFVYTGERFEYYFSDFKEKYGFIVSQKPALIKTESFIRREIMVCFNVVSLAIRKPMTMKMRLKKWC